MLTFKRLMDCLFETIYQEPILWNIYSWKLHVFYGLFLQVKITQCIYWYYKSNACK